MSRKTEDNQTCTYKNGLYSCDMPKEIQSNYCVLHEPTRQKDKVKFNEALKPLISLQRKDSETNHLDGIHFPDDFSLTQVIIKNRISFTNAVFYGKFEILKADFEKNAFFDGCVFNKDVKLESVKFLTEVSFANTKFHGKFEILDTEFEKGTFFGGKCIFNKEVELNSVKFLTETSFAGAEFHGKLKIWGTDFEKGAFWGRCVFNQEVEFEWVEFLAKTSFFKGKFFGVWKFKGVTFNGVTFYDAHFYKEGEFSHSTFKEFASFREIKIYEPSKIIFYFNHFLSDGRIWFEKVDLSKVSFDECDLRYVKFINVD